MESNPIIRPGTIDDVLCLLELIRELAVYEKAPDEVTVTLEETKNWGFGPHKIFDFFVAEENGKVLGIALYYYKYSTWKGKCLFLEDIIVTETHRRRGLGKLLFEAVARVAKEKKVQRMEWQVLEWNEPAIKFYEKYKANFDSEWINGKLTNIDLQGF